MGTQSHKTQQLADCGQLMRPNHVHTYAKRNNYPYENAY